MPKSKTVLVVAVLVIAVLVIAAFLAGFLPSYGKGLRLADELRQAQRQCHLAELRDLAGLLYLQASQQDYGLAASTSTLFFERARQIADETPDPESKRPIEDLLSLRDPITSELARGEPGVLSHLQALFLRTREATIATTDTARSQ